VPVSADMGEGDLFTPSIVFSGEQIIKPSRKPPGSSGSTGQSIISRGLPAAVECCMG